MTLDQLIFKLEDLNKLYTAVEEEKKKHNGVIYEGSNLDFYIETISRIAKELQDPLKKWIPANQVVTATRNQKRLQTTIKKLKNIGLERK